MRNGGAHVTLKAAAKSDPKALAGALTRALRENGASAEIHAIGAGAVNQAMKAIAIARGHLVPAGQDLICVPAFTRIQIDGQERTGLRLMVGLRNGLNGR
jgi:stage V sporulation protein S